jgi:putative transposase
MSDYPRANVGGGTYFFTVVMFRRRRILCNDTVRSALRDAIRNTQMKHPFTIDAWVLLPDHLHCI